MAKIAKKRCDLLKKNDFSIDYSIKSAINLLKSTSYVKFNASVTLAVSLGIDIRKTDQIIRGGVLLPHGTGKKVSILVLCSDEKQKEATDSGADYVGFDEYISKIESGWCDVNYIVTTPSLMPIIAKKIGRFLGPKGLMPSPKSGTVTENIADEVKKIRSGRISIKPDKSGIVHCLIGKVSFPDKYLELNLLEVIDSIKKLKPSSLKGDYIKSLSISSAMGFGIGLDKTEFL